MSKPKYNPFKKHIWQLAHGQVLELGEQSRVMGILNVTPDSFSDGGCFTDNEKAIDQAAQMIDEGADIIDVGGESTRPDARAVSAQVEQDRVLPIIEAIKLRFDTIISIDSYRATTAQMAIEAGAHLVNDVWGLQYEMNAGQENMAQIVSKNKAGVCIMHNSRERVVHHDVISDQGLFLDISLNNAKLAGIEDRQIVIDPGFGFGKDADTNFKLLARFRDLDRFQLPLLAGTSRKRFTGSILGGDDNVRNLDIVTSATSVIARMAGCQIFRVHDVKVNKTALLLADEVLRAKRQQQE